MQHVINGDTKRNTNIKTVCKQKYTVENNKNVSRDKKPNHHKTNDRHKLVKELQNIALYSTLCDMEDEIECHSIFYVHK